MEDNVPADDYDETASEPDLVLDLGGAEEPASDVEIHLDLDLGGEDDEDEDIALDFGADEPEDEEEQGEDAAVEAALAELRTELATKFGEWYVVHTYSGMENRVKQNLDSRVRTLNMEDYIFESVVPTEDVVEIRNGAKKTVTRTVLPGYVLVRMELTDESWAAVRHTPSVTGFVGHANDPVPLSLDEVVKMLAPSVIAKVTAAAGGASGRRKKVEVADFVVGDAITVVDGPFAGVHGSITEINPHNQRLKASVEFMGRDTPVDLTFGQIQKV